MTDDTSDVPGGRGRVLAVVVAVALAAAGGFVVARVTSGEPAARQAAVRAASRFAEARRLATALVEVDAAVRDLAGTQRARELVVDRALVYLDALAADIADDPALGRELALGYVRIGDILDSAWDPSLGKPGPARDAYRKAQAVVDRVEAAVPGDPATMAVRARIALGTAFHLVSDRDLAHARPALEQGLALARAAGPSPVLDPVLDRVTLARAHAAIGYAAVATRDLARAERALADQAAYLDTWPDRDATETRYWRASNLGARAELALRHGDPERAVELGRQATEILLPIAEREPGELVHARALTALALAGSGDGRIWLPSTGDVDGAEQLLRQNTELSETVLIRAPNDPRAIVRVAEQFTELALVVDRRAPDEALAQFEHALATYARAPAVRAPVLHCAMAVSLAKLGRADEARDRVRVGRELAADPLAAAQCEALAGRMERTLGDPAAAIAHLEAAAAALRGIDELDATIGLAETLEALAQLRPADACKLRDEALAAWRAKPIATAYGKRVDAELDQRRCR